ncbi:hypothetical protein GGI07_005192 [Coemansia sp. Benny D115]|nr:hypothetical protein GGI07_005192 [Coemansia sp. Benny D115]
MEHQILEALQGALSPESTTRTRSEQALKQMELDVSYSLGLANIARQENIAAALRQSALLQLRGYIERHWSIGATKYETGPIPSQELKSKVREHVFSLLASSSGKLRSAAAASVASMARYDWPDEWPGLFGQLVELLRSGTSDQIQASMQVFSEWVNSDMSEQHMAQIGTLLPELLRIFVDESCAVSTRAMAVRVFGDCIEIISNMSVGQREFVDKHAPPILEQWMQPILAVFAQPVTNAGGRSNIPLKSECIKAVGRAALGMPRHMAPYNTAMLETLWAQLRELQEPFQHAFVYEDGARGEEAADLLVYCEGDDDAYTIDSYLLGIFEWLGKAAETRSLRRFFVTREGDALVATPFLSQLVACLMAYAQITTEMLEDWADDVDLFVADEDEEGFRFNVRVSVQELLQTLDMAFPRPLVQALGIAATERSRVAQQWRAEGNDSWWLISEALLWAVGTSADTLAQQQNPAIDMGALFETDVWPLAQSAQFPYGQGRAFIFASGLARVLPEEIARAFVGACATAVADAQLHAAVRLSAVRAIGNFSRHLSADVVRPHQGAFIQGLASIIPQLTEDSAHVALDALHATLRVDQTVTASMEPTISAIAIGVWQKYPGDVLLTSIVIDIVEDMAANAQAAEAFAQRALPAIGEAMAQQDDGTAVASGIDLLTGLLKGGPVPLPAGYTESVFPVLMQVLAVSSDSEVLQSGQACLRYFVQKDAQRIAQWRENGTSGRSGLELVVAFVANMLAPSASESAALFIGDLAAKIVTKCSAWLAGDVLAELVRVVTIRLATARTASFTASLLPFYAHLVVRHAAEVVALLNAIQVEDGRSGLRVVLDAWFQNFLDVQGYYSRKVSAVALTQLFALDDARVNGLIVQGDLVPNTANRGRIVTRSLSRANPDQYTQIPAVAKIIKLLLAEVEMDVEALFARQEAAGLSSVVNADEGLDDDDEDGEWEDDEYEDDAADEGYGLLSDLVDSGDLFDEDDDDGDDEDVINDPIYSQDLNETLGTFFNQVVSSDLGAFRTVIQPTLTTKESALLSKISSSFRN